MGSFNDDFDGMGIQLRTDDIARLIDGLAKIEAGDERVLEVCLDQLLLNELHSKESAKLESFVVMIEAACKMLETVSLLFSFE